MNEIKDKFWTQFEYMRWYISTSTLHPCTRGIWIDAICLMEHDRTASITGDDGSLASRLFCTPAQLQAAIADLETHKAADVTRHNGTVTLTCRFLRERLKVLESNAERQRRYRERKQSSNGSNGECHTDASALLCFVTELKPLYPGINVEAEVRKMQAWLLTDRGRSRKLTKRFMVNWLNKCDQPLHHKPAGKPAAKPKLSAFDRKKAHSDIEEMRRELDYARERGAATDVKHLETAIRNRQKELND